MHPRFPFYYSSQLGVICSRQVLNSSFAISPPIKVPTSHFYSSQHVENGNKKTTSYMYTISGTNTLRQRYLQVLADLFTFTKEIFKNHPFSCSVPVNKISLCLELRLKKKSQFQKIIFFRDFDFDFDTHPCSFLNHFHARRQVPKRHTRLNKAATFNCRFV